MKFVIKRDDQFCSIDVRSVEDIKSEAKVIWDNIRCEFRNVFAVIAIKHAAKHRKDSLSTRGQSSYGPPPRKRKK